jgi:PAS domain S-box-containing protein
LVWLRLIGQRIGLYNDELSKVLFASASMVVFAVLVYWNAMKLNDADIQRDAVLATLEQRVDERTRQLEFERARWQGIVEGIADEVWSCDAQGRMSLLNLGTVTAMGIKSFKDKSIEEIYQEVDLSYPNGQPRPPEQAPLLRSLRGEIVRGEEIMRHRRIGLTRYRQFSSAPTVDATGAITGAVAIVRDITEQKHAEEGLHRFELLSEYSKDIVLFMRREDGRILDANLAAQRAYGYSRDELLSLTVRKLRARGTRELTGDQVIQADQEGILYETVHQRKEGSNFPVEVSSQGAVIGGVPTLINIVRDITERKQAEAKLEYQAELLASVRDAVVGTDEKLQVSFWNAAAEEMFGWKSDEVIGKETAQLFKTQIRGYSREEAIQKLMTIGEFDGEVSYARKDDSRFIGHARSIVLRGPQGDFNGLVTTVRDITERKQAEEAVQRSEAMLRTVLDQMPSGVTVRDARTSELLLSNTRSQEIMGSLANTPNQYAQYRGLHPDGLPYQGEGWPLSSSMATGDVVHAEEVNFTRSDGSQYTLSINSAPIRDSQGQIVMAVAVFDDITERKQAEEQLSAALQEKVVLLKEIHHRVKNNLQVISSLLRLQSTASGDPQVREFLADSQRRVRAMALIHEQLYQSSNLAQINFKDYIQKLVHYLRRSYTQAISNVEVRVTVEDINIEIEQAVPLGLIISELVSNSLKHAFSSLQSKQTGEVWITAQRESLGDLFLSVGDNGAGMPENLDLEHSPTLGLQLVQSFVDQLQGQLTVQRKPGTIFTITIPEKKD